jgi:hypothetical protein
VAVVAAVFQINLCELFQALLLLLWLANICSLQSVVVRLELTLVVVAAVLVGFLSHWLLYRLVLL